MVSKVYGMSKASSYLRAVRRHRCLRPRADFVDY